MQVLAGESRSIFPKRSRKNLYMRYDRVRLDARSIFLEDDFRMDLQPITMNTFYKCAVENVQRIVQFRFIEIIWKAFH
jgi:hypothetical protein